MNTYQDETNYLISGRTLNEIARAVNEYEKGRSPLPGNGAVSCRDFRAGEIRVVNSGNSALSRLAPVALGDVLLTGEGMNNIPTFQIEGATAANKDKPSALLLEYLDSGTTGKALLLGVSPVPVSVNVLNSADAFAKPSEGTPGTWESCSSGGTAKILHGTPLSVGKAEYYLEFGGSASSDSEPDAVPAMISGGSSTAGYNITLYANGYDQPYTGVGTLFLLEISDLSNLPAGSRILAHRSTVKIIGGND